MHGLGSFEILVLTDLHAPELDGVVGPESFALFCTPVINLFPRRADRIQLTDAATEYHVVPDRTRPMDFEVFSLGAVAGIGANDELERPFQPFFAWNDRTTRAERPAYYTVQRQPRTISAKQRAHGTRSSYVGSEGSPLLVDVGRGAPFATISASSRSKRSARTGISRCT